MFNLIKIFTHLSPRRNMYATIFLYFIHYLTSWFFCLFITLIWSLYMKHFIAPYLIFLFLLFALFFVYYRTNRSPTLLSSCSLSRIWSPLHKWRVTVAVVKTAVEVAVAVEVVSDRDLSPVRCPQPSQPRQGVRPLPLPLSLRRVRARDMELGLEPSVEHLLYLEPLQTLQSYQRKEQLQQIGGREGGEQAREDRCGRPSPTDFSAVTRPTGWRNWCYAMRWDERRKEDIKIKLHLQTLVIVIAYAYWITTVNLTSLHHFIIPTTPAFIIYTTSTRDNFIVILVLNILLDPSMNSFQTQILMKTLTIL
jgi:hypothetical protein